MKRGIISILLLLFTVLLVTLPLQAAPVQSVPPAQNALPGGSSGISPVAPSNSSAPVAANFQKPMTDIHDIRQPIQVGVNPALYYWGAGGVLAAVLVGLLIFLWWRWHSRQNGLPPEIAATVYENPEEEALRRLAELDQEQTLTPVKYYFFLSALFRRWIQRRFDIDAPEMTTEELLPAMTRSKLDLPMFSEIKSFFHFADQVKFARAGCEAQTMKQHHQLVRDIVERTSAATVESSEDTTAARPAEDTEKIPAKKLEERT